MGNGDNTYFWHDNWVGDCILKVKFPRLFNCSLLKEATIAEMRKCEGNSWEWVWKWRRNFSARNSHAFNNLLNLVDRIKLSKQVEDSWRWKYTPNEIYSTRRAYQRKEKMAADSEERRMEKKNFLKALCCDKD